MKHYVAPVAELNQLELADILTSPFPIGRILFSSRNSEIKINSMRTAQKIKNKKEKKS